MQNVEFATCKETDLGFELVCVSRILCQDDKRVVTGTGQVGNGKRCAGANQLAPAVTLARSRQRVVGGNKHGRALLQKKSPAVWPGSESIRASTASV